MTKLRNVFIVILIILSYNVFGQVNDSILATKESESLAMEDRIYEVFECQEQPAFSGGVAALQKYIIDQIFYKKNWCGIEGFVYVRFIITKSGEIGKVNIMVEVDPLLAADAINLVKSMPKWEPAKIKGKPVNAWYILRLKFYPD